ncbi:signal peptidase I [Vagococcus sp.]|uniref:signal peptidase I n=1 Tax=Vagococcus sp. TaxID=1933889 RepID=UPI002FC915E4
MKTKKKEIEHKKKRKKSPKIKNDHKKKKVNSTKKKSVRNQKKRKRKKKKKNSSLVVELLVSLGIGITVSLVIFFYICSFETMTGNGMAPTINKGDIALLNKRTSEFNRFDVISLKKNQNNGLVRIIGLPGENIRYSDDYLYVNEQPVDEKFLIKEINHYNKNGKTFTEGESNDQLLQVNEIPKDKFLVLGDNRPYATDSRYYGLISKEDIKGKATILVLPIRRIDDY